MSPKKLGPLPWGKVVKNRLNLVDEEELFSAVQRNRNGKNECSKLRNDRPFFFWGGGKCFYWKPMPCDGKFSGSF